MKHGSCKSDSSRQIYTTLNTHCCNLCIFPKMLKRCGYAINYSNQLTWQAVFRVNTHELCINEELKIINRNPFKTRRSQQNVWKRHVTSRTIRAHKCLIATFHICPLYIIFFSTIHLSTNCCESRAHAYTHTYKIHLHADIRVSRGRSIIYRMCQRKHRPGGSNCLPLSISPQSRAHFCSFCPSSLYSLRLYCEHARVENRHVAPNHFSASKQLSRQIFYHFVKKTLRRMYASIHGHARSRAHAMSRYIRYFHSKNWKKYNERISPQRDAQESRVRDVVLECGKKRKKKLTTQKQKKNAVICMIDPWRALS